ncbi:MAG: ATP-binding protein [Firmicutes bacterium]|nr:ATP-binding protein [Bacillota bacterium]
MADKITLSIPGQPEYAQVARITLGSVAGVAGFDVEKIDDIEVAFSEAWKLVTCHGHSLWGEKYDLEAVIYDDRMEITFSDTGNVHEIEKTCKQCARCPEEGDLSVFVLNSLMNEVEMSSDDNGNRSIRMVKVK